MDILSALLQPSQPTRSRTLTMNMKIANNVHQISPSIKMADLRKNITSEHKQQHLNSQSISMKKSLDEHQITYQSIKLVKNQAKQTRIEIQKIKQRNTLLIQKYQSIIQTIDSLETSQKTNDLQQLYYLCQNSLISASRKMSQSLTKSKLSQSILIPKGHNRCIQTQQILPIQQTFNNYDMNKITQNMKKLQQQNKLLKQKLQISEKIREQKLISLKDILLKTTFQN